MDVPRDYRVTLHAVTRYKQRVYSLGTEADLRAVLATAAVTLEDPAGLWLYLTSPGGVVFALSRRDGRGWSVTTVMPDDELTRGQVLRGRAAAALVRAGYAAQQI